MPTLGLRGHSLTTFLLCKSLTCLSLSSVVYTCVYMWSEYCSPCGEPQYRNVFCMFLNIFKISHTASVYLCNIINIIYIYIYLSFRCDLIDDRSRSRFLQCFYTFSQSGSQITTSNWKKMWSGPDSKRDYILSYFFILGINASVILYFWSIYICISLYNFACSQLVNRILKL